MSPVQRVPVALGARAYDVFIGDGAFAGLAENLPFSPRRWALVTDSNVGPLYANDVAATLTGAGFPPPVVITVPAGEPSKSIAQFESVLEQMIAAGLDRGSLLVALGGGVVGDLAGFAAAVFFRGIPWILLPTSIVAQVDSAIGGKTGVNARGGKNLLGAFHQPSAVFADIATLRSLPPREWNEGWAEVIKHAIIRDAALFEQLEQSAAPDLREIVPRNVAIKAAVVAADEHEQTGERALLNFGHTLGHGIEAAAGYGALLHGEALSLGLLAACFVSEKRAGFPAADSARVRRLLERFSLPTRLPAGLTYEAILAATARDKKFAAGAIRFVLTSSLGSAFVSRAVTPDDLAAALRILD